MLKFPLLNFTIKRLFSSTPSPTLERMNNRILLRVSGPEVANYLQGLITNDVQHLSSGPSSMYTMFLNNAGRVLCDSIVYRKEEKDSYLIECDGHASDTLQKHLRLYRVRRKIDIINITDEMKVYALFTFNSNALNQSNNDDMNISDGAIVSRQKLNEYLPLLSFQTHKNITIFRDPRIADLGFRIIAKSDVTVEKELAEITPLQGVTPEKTYRQLRYSLGVGEGIEDLPPGDCFPLECNCDYLHGVSFHKGCYIGQELTARVYHTGVVRKRLMPIYFTQVPSRKPEEKIIQDKVNLGKLRGVENNTGLALLRISKALAFKELKLGDGVGLTHKPNWWPVEAPKEKISPTEVHY